MPESPPRSEGTISLGGDLVASPQPQEVVFPLREDQFETLCSADDVPDHLRWRDILISVGATSIAALLGYASTIDWEKSLKERLTWTLFWTILYSVAIVASAIVATYLHIQTRKPTKAKARQKLLKKIAACFPEATDQ